MSQEARELLAKESGVPIERIETRQLSPDEWDALVAAAERVFSQRLKDQNSMLDQPYTQTGFEREYDCSHLDRLGNRGFSTTVYTPTDISFTLLSPIQSLKHLIYDADHSYECEVLEIVIAHAERSLNKFCEDICEQLGLVEFEKVTDVDFAGDHKLKKGQWLARLAQDPAGD